MRKRWYRLDTAALIFPVIARRNWSNAFRVSATLKEAVDPALLTQAVHDMRRRFPTFFVTLRKGFFWYYLEESSQPVKPQGDFVYPLTYMSRSELKKNCLRVLYHQNRLAVECFHSVTDGHGGLVFLANLTARYLELKYGIDVPHEGFIRDLNEEPTAEELEDSFLKNAAPAASGRREERCYRLNGTAEPDGFRTLTTGIVDTSGLIDLAHRYKVTVSAFIGAVMAECIIGMQDEKAPKRKQRPVKVTFPINLRRLFGSTTVRNFALALNIGVDPRYGDYSLEELCTQIHHELAAAATRQNMAGMIAANVEPQQAVAIRLAPIAVKSIVMDSVYRRVGESGCLNISNISGVPLPAIMEDYIERVEFIIGPQRSYPNNCAVLSYGGKTYINMIRNIRESELERRFFSRLVELGLPVEIESNKRS
jgi:NRPS condensation-like uncharacterized protein